MIPPLTSIRVPCAYEANSVGPVAVANHQQAAALGVANRQESALVLRVVGVVPRDRQRVVENCDSVFERDSVLAKITPCFRVIPLKACRHAQRQWRPSARQNS